jgi:hypothetical protein
MRFFLFNQNFDKGRLRCSEHLLIGVDGQSHFERSWCDPDWRNHLSLMALRKPGDRFLVEKFTLQTRFISSVAFNYTATRSI